MKDNRQLLTPAVFLLAVCLLITFVSMAIYFLETDFSDDALYYLLAAVRYSSFIILICSVYIFTVNLIRMIRKSRFLFVLCMAGSFLSALYGAALFVFEIFINSFTGGL